MASVCRSASSNQLRRNMLLERRRSSTLVLGSGQSRVSCAKSSFARRKDSRGSLRCMSVRYSFVDIRLYAGQERLSVSCSAPCCSLRLIAECRAVQASSRAACTLSSRQRRSRRSSMAGVYHLSPSRAAVRSSSSWRKCSSRRAIMASHRRRRRCARHWRWMRLTLGQACTTAARAPTLAVRLKVARRCISWRMLWCLYARWRRTTHRM
mmetsp:Transcript_22357/g.65927  ORF Transcript_22357/g.65927 Transcript_22357/m.65927 type:complete len:209 (+) Transcript_22357:416-1042(+)